MDDWSIKPGSAYAEKAIKFRKSIGADSYPIIGRQTHPQQWRDWYAYYGFRRLYAAQELMRERDEKTVPTLSPFDFDGGFNPSRPSPEVPSNKGSPASTATAAHSRPSQAA